MAEEFEEIEFTKETEVARIKAQIQAGIDQIDQQVKALESRAKTLRTIQETKRWTLKKLEASDVE